MEKVYKKQRDGSYVEVEKSPFTKTYKQSIDLLCENDTEKFLEVCKDIIGMVPLGSTCVLRQDNPSDFGSIDVYATIEDKCHHNELTVGVTYRVPNNDLRFYLPSGDLDPLWTTKLPSKHIGDRPWRKLVEKMADEKISISKWDLMKTYFDLPRGSKIMGTGSKGYTSSWEERKEENAFDIFKEFKIKVPPIRTDKFKLSLVESLKSGIEVISNM